MIVNLRGTSGAGKSTIVRAVMDRYRLGGQGVISEHFRAGRKQPYYYTMTRADAPRPLWVLGHYNTACGGCDTIKTVDEVYLLVHEAINNGADVLFEGIMVQDDRRRMIELNQEGHAIHVIGLDVDIEECLRSVRERRLAGGNDKPLDETNTRSRARSLENTYRKLTEGRVVVERLGREAALARTVGLLRC